MKSCTKSVAAEGELVFSRVELLIGYSALSDQPETRMGGADLID